ncbi:hypothetical protein LNQ81_07705 [Myroides sp. M-43]|uniref:DUF6864 domain-containing function n=1 Tax=Myroides oncorhynchi TaxID=2893756 RepID=UPI001E3301CE|nr:hypothetical protein [Myroides oncorhynchi]MCC9042573.1 hypothetical protein [Myroides oncorhynchi]
MIKSINKQTGESRHMVYSESILMLNDKDDLIFHVDKEGFVFSFQFSFVDEGDEFGTMFELNQENNFIHYTLQKWYSNTYVEISIPMKIETKEGKNFYIKFRSEAQKESGFRKFMLTIWE